ncbi:MAG: NPCBM/NEW2 domain-containing protein [Propionibacteriaceae bacterium]|jgi:hypothetical protein|nr:NPCBM/NEW2 domain-containing protein [Propionibacteriaceae bacterium]
MSDSRLSSREPSNLWLLLGRYWIVVAVAVAVLVGLVGFGIGRATAPESLLTETATVMATLTATETATTVVTVSPTPTLSAEPSQPATSSAFPTGALAWYYLDDIRSGTRISGYGDDGTGGTYSVNGATYHQTFTLGGYTVSCGNSCGNYVDPGDHLWSSWDLGRKCTTFRATLGINSKGDPSTTYSVYVKADEQIIWQSSTPVSFYSTQELDVALNNALRVEIGAYMDTGSRRTESHLVFADAQFLCSAL